MIIPKSEGQEVGGFDEQIFLWIESRILELVAEESELTLTAEEVLRTTVVVARTELLELFCTYPRQAMYYPRVCKTRTLYVS